MNIKENLTTINQWNDRAGHSIEGVVMHSMFGTYVGSISWFKNPKAKASAHYCVKEDGEITLCVPEDHAAWHAGIVSVSKDNAPQLIKDKWSINPNFITCGVEMADNRNKNWPYPDPQYQATVELVADICRRYNISVDRGHIIQHKEIDPMHRSDPVGKWNHDKFIQDVRLFIESQNDGYFGVNVTAKAGVNVRDNPSLKGNKKTVVAFGRTIYVRDFVIGESILDNNKWWKTKDNLFVWSGGTSNIPSDTKGSDMTIAERDAKKVAFEERAKVLEARRADLESKKAEVSSLDSELLNEEGAFKAEFESFLAEPVEEPVAEPVVEPVVEVAPEVVAEPEVKPEEKIGFIVEDEMPSDVKSAFVLINSLLEKYKDFIKK